MSFLLFFWQICFCYLSFFESRSRIQNIENMSNICIYIFLILFYTNRYIFLETLGFHPKKLCPNVVKTPVPYSVSPSLTFLVSNFLPKEVKVWQSNVTEIMLRIPPFELNGKEFNKLNFTKRMPAWRKPPEAEPKYFENDFKRKKFLGTTQMMCFFLVFDLVLCVWDFVDWFWMLLS